MREEDANTDYTQLTKTCPMFYAADRSSTNAVTGSTETWRGHNQMSRWRVFVNLRLWPVQQENMEQWREETKGGDQNKG